MRRATILLVTLLIAAATAPASTETNGLDTGSRFQPLTRQGRTLAGDLCTSAVELGRNQSLTVDLCQAWNDYDPGGFSCSPCSLPGPEVVARIDVQAGEQLRVTAHLVSGYADVRIYLATDCEDPQGTCFAASSGPGAEFQHTATRGGEVFLYVDTTGECATVQVSRQAPASLFDTSFSALKAVYR
jgi:hypothetical protein